MNQDISNLSLSYSVIHNITLLKRTKRYPKCTTRSWFGVVHTKSRRKENGKRAKIQGHGRPRPSTNGAIDLQNDFVTSCERNRALTSAACFEKRFCLTPVTSRRVNSDWRHSEPYAGGSSPLSLHLDNKLSRPAPKHRERGTLNIDETKRKICTSSVLN